MELNFAYRRRSGIDTGPSGVSIALAPNLRRDRVAYDGRLKDPLGFREAISALHDVVVSDLRYEPRDRTAYEEYKRTQEQQENEIRKAAFQSKKAEMTAVLDMPPGLEEDYRRHRNRYWQLRQQYSTHLLKNDQQLWRYLMPCDPVITVAPDSLFFECFSADESSYGCLSVMRDGFEDERDVALGTTNVDYSWSLYEHFQQLRSYRQTRFQVDPTGFDVNIETASGHREEKIELPSSWLRGFMQLQSAMSLPARRVPVSREGLYNVLAFLRRHRAARSPRAVRFELDPGQPVVIVLEPWEKRIVLHSTPYTGVKFETIRVWGRDRLRVLARMLPIAEGAEVHLLGTGLPSFWVIRMGNLRMTVGLSGWTTNDWTAGSALTQLAPPADVDELTLNAIASSFVKSPSQSLDEVCSHSNTDKPTAVAGLNRLSLYGQVIHDLPSSVYRWRQVVPAPLSAEQLVSTDAETVASASILENSRIAVQRDETLASGMRVIACTMTAKGHEPRSVELVLDGDGRIVRGKCACSHHFKNALRKGPCRHLQAMRNHLLRKEKPASLEHWYKSFWN